MTVWSFLRPTLKKLIFLAEWTLFLLIALLRGDLEIGRQLLVASYPLVFFYVVACILCLLSRRTVQLATGWRLTGLALILAGVDQLSKAWVVARILDQTSVPIVEAWLHLGHVTNPHGSWVLSTLGAHPALTWLLLIAVPIVLLGEIASHRYYVTSQRSSLWADLAFLGLFAGCTGWLCDMVLRGHIVDTIVLPGVVAADLKDLLVTFGAAALVVEAVGNPGVSLRPRGWRTDGLDLLGLAGRVARFSVAGVRGVWKGLVDGHGEPLPTDPAGTVDPPEAESEG